MRRRAFWLFGMGFILIGLHYQPEPNAFAGTVIGARVPFVDPYGITRNLSFTGQAGAGTISGSIVLDGNTMLIDATVARGGYLKGTVQLKDGRQLGSFTGTLNATSVSVQYEAGGTSGSWTAQLSSIPGAQTLLASVGGGQ